MGDFKATGAFSVDIGTLKVALAHEPGEGLFDSLGLPASSGGARTLWRLGDGHHSIGCFQSV